MKVVHTVTYVYGKETPADDDDGTTTFETNDAWKATEEGVTHHRAKCSVCGLYLDSDYVKHSYTEYVNVQATGDVGYNRFAAVCECGHEVYAKDQGAKNLRQALQDAATNGIPVVHIVAPYWQVQGPEGKTDLKGIHIHLDGSSEESAGQGAIKV